MSKELAKLFAAKFIQRPDVKAVQLDRAGGGLQPGDWFPDTRINPEKRPDSPHLPRGFNMDHLLAHLAGERTYGHYLLGQDNTAKVFCFDIDIKKAGSYVLQPDWTKYAGADDPAEQELWYMENSVVGVVEGKEIPNLRDIWASRKREHVLARNWLKLQMRTIAHKFASAVTEMQIPCAVAYSGSKGIHVYGMTGSLPASEVRAAAMMALDMTGEFKATRGKNFFEHKNDDPHHGLSNFDVEVFPKQESLDGKNLGNLLRLPLGKNWKNPKDPTFFLDMTAPLSEFKPHADPVALLKSGNPFA